MKKLILVLAALMFLCTGKAFAVPQAALDFVTLKTLLVDQWYLLSQLPDVNGNVWVGEHSLQTGNNWHFEYVLWNENYTDTAGNPTSIGNFKIYNPYAFALSNISTPTISNKSGFVGWTNTVLAPGYIQWIASTGSALANGEGAAYFDYDVLNQNVLHGVVPAEAYNGSVSEDADGYVSGPTVPEPASMLLLGMGVLGLFGLRRKKVA